MNKNIESLEKLKSWLIKSRFRAYDPFDGLNSFGLRLLTFENSSMLVALQNVIRQLPFNIRPWVGIHPSLSSKGMAFICRGLIHSSSFENSKKSEKLCKSLLNWLIVNCNRKYSGVSWGNHFDYKSRLFYLPKNEPTVVWTALIGHIFVDAYERFEEPAYLSIADSACQFITNDLPRGKHTNGVCISYIPEKLVEVHNSNMLASSLLSRVSFYNKNKSYLTLSDESMKYSVSKINDDFSWYYSEDQMCQYVDNFHTAYNLDSLFYYNKYRSKEYEPVLLRAFSYYIDNFFEGAIPKYYDNKKYPIDIQCCSQSIETLIKLKDFHPKSKKLALEVLDWTIDNMQDDSGFFYFRKHPGFYNKTPTLHWGQATMFSSLSSLLLAFYEDE